MCQGLRSCFYMFCFKGSSSLLNVVSSLTSHAMVAAPIGFIVRRGISSKVVSENANNFLSARLDLNELEKVIRAGHNHRAAFNGYSFLLAHPTSADDGKER